MERCCQLFVAVFGLDFMKNDRIALRHLSSLYFFYRNGFKSMTVGRTLWKIIFIKIIFIFIVLKIFFFPDYLKTNFQTDKQRASYVLDQIIRPAVLKH